LFFFYEQLVEVGVTDLVAGFELAVVLTLLLNGVVCQVDEHVVPIVELELLATCPDVPLVVEPASQHSFFPLEVGHVSQKSENSDVELATMD